MNQCPKRLVSIHRLVTMCRWGLTLVVRCFQVPSASFENLALNIPCRRTIVFRASTTLELSIFLARRTVMLWLNRLVPLCPLTACWKYKSWIGESEKLAPETALERPVGCFFDVSARVDRFASSSIESVWMMSCRRTVRPCLRALDTTAMPVILSPPERKVSLQRCWMFGD